MRHEENLPLILKALMERENLKQLSLSMNPAQAPRIVVMSPIAEDVSISCADMLQVFHWGKVIETFLALQARIRPIEDGEKTFLTEGGPSFTVTVRGGVPTVREEEGRAADFALPAMEMQRLFFDVTNLVRLAGLPASWGPLPFWISDADTF